MLAINSTSNASDKRPLLEVDVAMHFFVLHDFRNAVEVVGDPSVGVVIDDTCVKPRHTQNAVQRWVEPKVKLARHESLMVPSSSECGELRAMSRAGCPAQVGPTSRSTLLSGDAKLRGSRGNALVVNDDVEVVVALCSIHCLLLEDLRAPQRTLRR
jgi:hypothetical protein